MLNEKYPEKTFSFEFFPPKTESGKLKLDEVLKQLGQLNPKFFSVTFGAGGSTREFTLNTVLDIQSKGYQSAPHLSCIGSTKESIASILDQYRENGIKRIVALRGDLPSGTRDVGELRYANELVEFIRNHSGDAFHIEVAGYPEIHPQAKSFDDDLLNFKRKVDAGANSAITQYFYNIDAYLYFRDQCDALGIEIPIFPGIMPINNFSQLCRFSDMCGAEVPRWLKMKMQSFGDDSASIRAFGLDVVTDLCDKLLQNDVPGLHFYTMNQAGLVSTIWQRLAL